MPPPLPVAVLEATVTPVSVNVPFASTWIPPPVAACPPSIDRLRSWTVVPAAISKTRAALPPPITRPGAGDPSSVMLMATSSSLASAIVWPARRRGEDDRGTAVVRGQGRPERARPAVGGAGHHVGLRLDGAEVHDPVIDPGLAPLIGRRHVAAGGDGVHIGRAQGLIEEGHALDQAIEIIGAEPVVGIALVGPDVDVEPRSQGHVRAGLLVIQLAVDEDLAGAVRLAHRHDVVPVAVVHRSDRAEVHVVLEFP